MLISNYDLGLSGAHSDKVHPMLTRSTNAPTTFRFMDLPPELRQQIYSHIFENKRYLNGLVLNKYVTNTLEGLPPICRTNSQIRAEAFVAYLSRCVVNFSTSPRPNIRQVQKYIAAYDLRVDFWHHVRQAHLILRFPTATKHQFSDGCVQNLLQAASNLRYLELHFSGWPTLPSGPVALCSMGDREVLDLLAKRMLLREVKIIWTVNAPGWVYKPEASDLMRDKKSWEATAQHIQQVFTGYDIGATVIPWLEGADRRLWEQSLMLDSA